MNETSDDSQPPSKNKNRKWRLWHEREIPVKITGTATKTGINIEIDSQQLKTNLALEYPNSIWPNYPKDNKVKLLDNITYIFTAHLPFLLKGNIRTEYNTGYPQTYSYAIQCFMRFLPAYWYWYRGKRGTAVFPMLKTLLNSRSSFSETKDVPPRFPTTIDSQVIIPFTFGKDSFLTYYLAKELKLNPCLIYFQEPTEAFAKKHKLKLIEEFEKTTGEKVYFIDNPLGTLRSYGEGWFGWELAITSWALLSLPFAYKYKSGYLIFSNEMDVNKFFYDSNGLKVIPDFDQSSQSIEELSLITQALSEGELYTTTFLQGLCDSGIIGILKERYYQHTFKQLMSCWAEDVFALEKRWCGHCSKCARLYIYMVAAGIDPIKEAGFEDNMLDKDKAHLYNVFGQKASGTGWDAFGLNTQEQALAFYLAYLRGNRDYLVTRFKKTSMYKEVNKNFDYLVDTYYSLHNENITPPQWKPKLDKIINKSLLKIRTQLKLLNQKAPAKR